MSVKLPFIYPSASHPQNVSDFMLGRHKLGLGCKLIAPVCCPAMSFSQGASCVVWALEHWYVWCCCQIWSIPATSTSQHLCEVSQFLVMAATPTISSILLCRCVSASYWSCRILAQIHFNLLLPFLPSKGPHFLPSMLENELVANYSSSSHSWCNLQSQNLICIPLYNAGSCRRLIPSG